MALGPSAGWAAGSAEARQTALAALEKATGGADRIRQNHIRLLRFPVCHRLRESGITFQNLIVDDVGRDYKAIHYDHGNSVSVADVDGDGLLDVYFTTQLGTNELWRNLGQGRFENITSRAGVGLADQIAVAASFADIDK